MGVLVSRGERFRIRDVWRVGFGALRGRVPGDGGGGEVLLVELETSVARPR